MTGQPAAAAATRPATAPRPATVGAGVARWAGRAGRLLPERGTATTPRRLAMARLVHLVLAVVLGVGSVVTAAQLDQREALAEAHAAQYVRTAVIETQLLTAHAAASRAGLSGAAEQVTDTRAALDEASTQLVEAAAEQSGDAAALGAIGHQLLRYAEALERAQLLRGTTEGRTALAAADDLLRTDLLPAIQQLQEFHSAATPGVVWWMWLLPILGWLTVAFIVVVSWYTARVSRRVVNVGLAAAAVATLVLAISAGNLVAGHSAGTAGSVTAEFTDVQNLTTAQRDGIGAFALLANGVATQSWTSQDAEAYTASLDQAARLLEESGAESASTALTALRRASEQVATAAAGRDWEKAGTLLQQSTPTDPARIADSFLEGSRFAVDQSLDDLRSAVRAQGAQTTGFAVLAAVCALISAIAGALGLQQRLKEYR